jgi:transcription elongation factor Elf1
MSTDSHEPKRFECPDCGRRHKADLHGMVGHPEVHGKVPCASCGKTLWISLDEEGQPVVVLYEEHLHEAIHQERIAAQQAKAEAAAVTQAAAVQESSAGGGSSVLLTLITAAIVAAAVSLLMGGGKGEDGRDGRIDALGAEIEALQSAPPPPELDVLNQRIVALEKQLGARIDALKKAGGGDDAVLRAIEETKTELSSAIEAVKAAYKTLDGRIEGNYTTLRQIDKRLKALESR